MRTGSWSGAAACCGSPAKYCSPPSRHVAGGAGVAGAAGAAAGTAVAADRGHEHLHQLPQPPVYWAPPPQPPRSPPGPPRYSPLPRRPRSSSRSGGTIVRPVVNAICKPGPHLYTRAKWSSNSFHWQSCSRSNAKARGTVLFL